MANLTPLIQKGGERHSRQLQFSSTCGEKLAFLELSEGGGQPKMCTLNIDSQSERFLKEREKEMGRVAKGSLFSYLKSLNILKG